MIKKLSICGLRGFGKEQTIDFAIPTGTPGSGLTFIVGSNNSGKTTILEALRSFNNSSNQTPNFSERKRNAKCDSKVCLALETAEGMRLEIKTTPNGGSPTEIVAYDTTENNVETYWEGLNAYILQSRRYSEYEFDRLEMDRGDYIQNQLQNNSNRSASLMWFNSRIFKMYKNKEIFDNLLKKVLGYDLQWTIEQYDNDRFYLKIIINRCVHSSEGLGDGIWSVFTICDALYDSSPDSIIAIDEPELSLHPAYQKRIMELLKEYSKDRQIIVNTHSPYLVDIASMTCGANLIRTLKNADGDIEIHELSNSTKDKLKGFLTDLNHPHTFGMEAKEIFFLEDGIVVVEGQEDVLMYRKAAEELKIPILGSFFGWGAGGAAKIPFILRVLKELGYTKVVAIYDGDKIKDMESAREEYPNFKFFSISVSDIRDKRAVNKAEKSGLMTERGQIKDEHRNEMKELLENINSCLFGA